jgi:hypothetical protein
MAEPGRVASDLPQLDRTDDPHGGAVGWAILSVAVALTAGIVALVIWLW